MCFPYRFEAVNNAGYREMNLLLPNLSRTTDPTQAEYVHLNQRINNTSQNNIQDYLTGLLSFTITIKEDYDSTSASDIVFARYVAQYYSVSGTGYRYAVKLQDSNGTFTDQSSVTVCIEVDQSVGALIPNHDSQT